MTIRTGPRANHIMIVQQTNQLGGANTNLSPFLQPANSPTILNGCNTTYKLGALLKDTGYVIVGSQIENNETIRGLFNFRQSADTQKMLATCNDATGDDDTQLIYSTGGAWSAIAAAETAWNGYEDMDVNMESFLGYCFFVGYGAVDKFLPVGSLTGTTFSTSTNVTNMPGAKYIKRYRDRLYIANCDITGTAYPYRVFFSSVPTAGAITWTVASDFIDVDYSEEIIGIGEHWDKLVIFTEFSAYMYDQSQKKKVWDVGGYHRTIQNHSSNMYFANGDGVWASSGGQPENISGPIIDFIRVATPSDFSAAIVDEEYHIYLGSSLQVNGVTYTNVVATFNIPNKTWRWREMTDQPNVLAKYTSSGVSHLWFGDTDGNVMKKGKYTDGTLLSSDNGEPINANFELAPIFVNNLSFEKELTRLTAYAERAVGLHLKARVINRRQRVLTPYKPLGELNKFINEFDVEVDKGVMIQIAGSEYGTNPYFSFYGIDMEVEKESKILKPNS